MYLDNYLKSNPSLMGQKFDHSSVSIYHQQSVNGFEPMQLNQRPYFNQRIGENTTVPSPGVNKNIEEQPKQYMAYQTGTTQHNNQHQQTFQVKNNISFNIELPSTAYNRETGEFMKRRDSITQNTFLRSNQVHSPSNNKSFVGGNGVKNNLRTTIATEQQRNMQQGQKNGWQSNNSSNLTVNGYKEQDYGVNQVLNKEQKDITQEKVQQKSGYFNTSNYSQYGFSQNKVNSKPYASGFKTGIQNFDTESKKTLQPYMKQKPLQQKELMYNFQLKNTGNQLTSFSKRTNLTNNDEYKYYTPSLAKKSSSKQDSNLLGKNGYSQLIDARHNNNMLEREKNVKENSNLTEREMYKSPWFDALLAGSGVRENFRNKLQSTVENSYQQHSMSSTSSTSLIGETISKQQSQQNIGSTSNNNHNVNLNNNSYTTNSKPSSQSFLPQALNDKLTKQSAKNYHALIQNLQKKFSQQKKSSESFQNKEKTFIAQLNKKDQKIKRLQTIIENNKQTIVAMETIKQLRRKHDEGRDQTQFKANYNASNDKNLTIIDELKRENGGLKQQLKRSRKKSISINDQLAQKQLIQKQQLKIKELQKILSQASIQKQTISQQLYKIKESNSSIQENYFQQIKQHQNTKQKLKQHQQIKEQLNRYQNTKQQFKQQQKTKDELIRTRQQFQQLNNNQKQKVQSFSQVKSMLQNLQQKYEGVLKKLVYQEQKFQQQCIQLSKQVQTQRRQRECKQEQVQKLKAKVQKLQGQVDLKSIKIHSLQEKIQITQKKLSQKQTQLTESLSTKQKLSHQQKAYSNISKQLSQKHYQLQLSIQQNTLYQNKIASLQSLNQALQLTILQYESAKVEQSPNKNSDSAQIKTLSSQSGKDSFQFRQTFSLLQLYHEKYVEIVAMLNLNESGQEKIINESQSLTLMPLENSQSLETSHKPLPSRQYIVQYHQLITDEVKKVLKDMKKLVNVLKQCQTEFQHKTQRIYELDKTLKKQANKINQLLGQIHLKNVTIIDINRMQVETDIFRLNEKYQILNHVGFGAA